MLFDLRGRGRRRTVRIIYLGMAVLMGVGLIGFGIGGGFGSSGIFNATSGNNGSNSASFGGQAKADLRLTQQQPNNPAAWAKLAHESFLLAGTGDNYDNSTASGTFTPKAQPVLDQAKSAWDRYLALNPDHPDANLAREMVQVFEGPGALNLAVPAVQAQQIVIAATPSPGLADYERLAVYAYQARNTREGDLAAAKAVSLAPAAQRAQVKAQLALLKKNPNALNSGSGSASAAGAAGGGTTVSVPATGAAGGATVTLPKKSGTTH